MCRDGDAQTLTSRFTARCPLVHESGIGDGVRAFDHQYHPHERALFDIVRLLQAIAQKGQCGVPFQETADTSVDDFKEICHCVRYLEPGRVLFDG